MICLTHVSSFFLHETSIQFPIPDVGKMDGEVEGTQDYLGVLDLEISLATLSARTCHGSAPSALSTHSYS